jgi:hypothetical protein
MNRGLSRVPELKMSNKKSFYISLIYPFAQHRF